MTDTGGQGLPALPILAHGKSQGFHLTTPLQDRETPILPIAGAETMGVQVAASLQAKPCVFARAKPGRAASPFAAGNRDVQGNVMGDADAIQPGLGETCIRTFPATSFGMTDTGGQGLPALPILAHGKSQGFHLTTPLQDRETPIGPIAGAETMGVQVAASHQAKPCVFARAKPGRAASPFAAGNRDVPSDDVGCTDATRPKRMGNVHPHLSCAFCRRSCLRRAGTARPTHPYTWECTRFWRDSSIGKIGVSPIMQVRVRVAPCANR